MTSNPYSIIWFRRDLRTSDNASLTAAIASGLPCIALYILDEEHPLRPLGSASRVWLHHSLAALEQSLKALNIPLLLMQGKAHTLFETLMSQMNIKTVHCQESIDPEQRVRDNRVHAILNNHNIALYSHPPSTLWHPQSVFTKQGKPYGVFTPFWRNCLEKQEPQAPLPVPPASSHPIHLPISGDRLDSWKLLPTKPDWAKSLLTKWNIGENGAHHQLRHFVQNSLKNYHLNRDFPYTDGTSSLSPHLHFGEISVHQIWTALKTHLAFHPEYAKGTECYLRELGWRDFCHYLLYHHPRLTQETFHPAFNHFPWQENLPFETAWQKGLTGYPIVDAGMRQLWQTGWMHNRVRMIVGSFLTKHLLQPWQKGEAWFWDTLLDADLANNIGGWQWISGCGADAAPYFRIFNPILQGEKFDPNGRYVREFVPELAMLPNAWIHKPWETPPTVLLSCGISLGTHYPYPIVNHSTARDAAMAAYRQLKARHTNI